MLVDKAYDLQSGLNSQVQRRQSPVQARALIIRDDESKFRDLEDVVKVARALGQQVFKTHKHVLVKRIWHDPEYGYVVIVEGAQSCTEPLNVRGWRKK